jgi:hypothetical protein
MNFFILTLALATIAGSHAFVLRDAPAPESKLAALFHRVDEYIEGVEKSIQRKWDLIAQSKSGKSLSDFLDDEDDDKGSDAKTPAEDHSTVDAAAGLVSDIADIVEKFFTYLEEVENATEPILKKIDADTAALLAPYVDPFLEKLEPYVEPLRQNLLEKAKELDHKLEERLKEHLAILDTKVPLHIQQLQEKHGPRKQARK